MLILSFIVLVAIGLTLASVPIMRKVYAKKSQWKFIVPLSILTLSIFSLPLIFQQVSATQQINENQVALQGFVDKYGASEQKIQLLNRAKLDNVWLFEYETDGQRYIALDLKELGWVEIKVEFNTP